MVAEGAFSSRKACDSLLDLRERNLSEHQDIHRRYSDVPLLSLMQSPKAKIAAAEALVGMWTVASRRSSSPRSISPASCSFRWRFRRCSPFCFRRWSRGIERWIGRIAAVLLVVALIFTGFGAAGWMLTRQLVDLATKLPEYKGNIVTKMHAFELPKGGAFTRLSADGGGTEDRSCRAGRRRPRPRFRRSPANRRPPSLRRRAQRITRGAGAGGRDFEGESAGAGAAHHLAAARAAGHGRAGVLLVIFMLLSAKICAAGSSGSSARGASAPRRARWTMRATASRATCSCSSWSM